MKYGGCTAKLRMDRVILEGIYECSIEDPKDPVVCKGILKERYWNKAGRVVKFKIQNGFYKKVLN